MPTTYAHYKHGETVTGKVSEEARKVILAYPELFHFGVHGPDLLFYHDALKRNAVNEMGHVIHEEAGRDFFEPAVKTIETVRKELKGDYRASLAYLYGFLCHYSLDVCCHGYIQEKMNASGISHSEIEAEFDRELLVRDGLDPVSTFLTGHLVPSGKNARVISRFFEWVSQEEIFKAMKDMVKYLNLLVLPNKAKRGAVLALLKLAGQYESKAGLIINYEKNMACADSTEHLITLFDRATDLAVTLIESFPTLDNEVFDYNFGSVNPLNGRVFKTLH